MSCLDFDGAAGKAADGNDYCGGDDDDIVTTDLQ